MDADLPINEQRRLWQRYMDEIGEPREILIAPGKTQEFGEMLEKHGAVLVEHIPPSAARWGKLYFREHPLMSGYMAIVRHEFGVAPPFSWEPRPSDEGNPAGESRQVSSELKLTREVAEAIKETGRED